MIMRARFLFLAKNISAGGFSAIRPRKGQIT
jgi:hypothetical protein